MNRDDVIRMAREAGLFVPRDGIPRDGALARFAALVRADEIEACAKVCENDESQAMDWMGTSRPGGYFADIIRARGNT